MTKKRRLPLAASNWVVELHHQISALEKKHAKLGRFRGKHWPKLLKNIDREAPSSTTVPSPSRLHLESPFPLHAFAVQPLKQCFSSARHSSASPSQHSATFAAFKPFLAQVLVRSRRDVTNTPPSTRSPQQTRVAIFGPRFSTPGFDRSYYLRNSTTIQDLSLTRRRAL